ncbi:hypothetical protein [Modestobacter sp. NPDC049651]|uniref:hypothetical protein n=1 Tax=unclassified Modestobacter TaxID=2643866 RepID=UPI0034077827
MTAPVDRDRGTALAGAAVLVCLLAALAVVQWAGRPRADDGSASFPEVERAVTDAGLEVCAEDDHPAGLAPGAVESRTYELAVRCAADGGRAGVTVDGFASTADRDAAARQFESLVRPRGSGVVWTLGRTTVFLQGSGDREVRDRLGRSLRAAGAR